MVRVINGLLADKVMADNLRDIIAKIDQGTSWVSHDHVSGVGPSKVGITVEPGWMGRLARETFTAVEVDRTTKLAKIIQRGIERVSLDPTNIMFDMEGGSYVINAKINSASVKASVVTPEGSVSKAYIVSMIVNGFSMKVPEEDSRYIVYADPDDPGATRLYDVSFVIAMPRNMDNEQHHEMFILNGKIVNINQQPNDIPYIILDHDFDNVTSENGKVLVKISSNTDYDIELTCCTCSDSHDPDPGPGPEPEPEFDVTPKVINMDSQGTTKVINITAGENVKWKIEEV